MSLKLKCNSCGFLLNFEIQNPGLILVTPCECCLQTPEVMAGADDAEDGMIAKMGGDHRFLEVVAMSQPGASVESRMIETIHGDRDIDEDGNIERPVKER